ncbi:hypothetical protein ABIC16_004224 [Sphingomonas sp. PvP055]|uniref:glycosyltransferase n=1 Tax=Sphingomonas sp. PvP055 TaxID=3156391 RepID=UPI00339785F7
MRPAFALLHTWPDLKNAEYEVLQRILKAADHCDVDVVVIDNNARILWSTSQFKAIPGETLDGKDVDFLLSLHFESPRMVDAYSYYTLWQPISFYMDFGYQKSIDKICTHNDLISCASDIADAHGLNLMAGVGRRPAEPLPRMFHTLPEPYLEPRITKDARLFYIGINWERIGRPKGRFHDVLIGLDKKDLVDIYGPESVLGVAPWEGFDSYQGELPFDGESVKYAINRSGICLVLSSLPHKTTGIMSNRLFEGLAGGAAIIATPNPIIDKFFRDAVYLVDDSRGEQHLGQQILDAVWKIRSDPDEARRRTLEGQRILREHCRLEDSILQLVAETPKRIARHEASFLAEAPIGVCLIWRGGSAEALGKRLEELAAQKRVTLDVHLLCDADFAARGGKTVPGLATGSIATITVHPIALFPKAETFDGIVQPAERTGPQLAAVLRAIDAPYFAILNEEDGLFSEHFASLAKVLETDPSAAFACSGMLVDQEDAIGLRSRRVEGSDFTAMRSILLVNGESQAGRFLYRSSLIDDGSADLLNLLDGEEHSYFRLAACLAGPLAQTGYSTYLLDQTILSNGQRPSETIEFQRQYIRDRFKRDARWLARLAAGGDLPQFVYAYGPGSPISWSEQVAPAQAHQRIPANQSLPTKAGGRGVPCLAAGFSAPEADYTWVCAERGIVEFSIQPDDVSADANYDILLTMFGRRSFEAGREQHCTFALNGKIIAYQRIPETPGVVRLAVPMQQMGRPVRFRLELIPDHAEQVCNAEGRVIDARRLSVALASIEVRQEIGAKLPVLGAGALHPCHEKGAGVDALFSGFYPPEGDFTWMAGCQAALRFVLDAVPTRPVLRIRMESRPGFESKQPLEAMFVLNGTKLGTYRLAEPAELLKIRLSDACGSGGLMRLNIEISHAEAVYDASHQIIDNRLLGAAIVEFGIFNEDEDSDDVSEILG